MGQNPKINVAIIGLGWVATNRHIPIILRHPGLHLFGVVDKREDRIGHLRTQYPWLKSAVSLAGDMPWADEIQAVLIATDPLNHYAVAKNILQAGKHVLLEKPLTMTPEEGWDLRETARRAGVLCCVVHNFQFASSTLRLQRLLRDGRLGKIEGIEAVQLSNPKRRLPAWYEQLPHGLFYDESPHMLYMLEALSGQRLRHITSTILSEDGRNTPLSVTAYYAAGMMPIRLAMNFQAAVSEWHVAVMGSVWMGVVDVFRDILVTMPNDGSHRAREILASSASFITGHLAGFIASGVRLARRNLFYGADVVWDRFVAAVEGKRPADEISVDRGIHVVELQHQLMTKSMSVGMQANENSGS